MIKIEGTQSLIHIIKNKSCEGISCEDCPFHTTSIDNSKYKKGHVNCSISVYPIEYNSYMIRRYKGAINLFLSLYSQEELFEVLL